MLTCATHPSTNLYWCSSPTWKPFWWPSASPVWSSRQLQIYVEYWVCSSSLFCFHFNLSFAVPCSMPLPLSSLYDLKHTQPPQSPWSLILSWIQTSEDLRNCPCKSLQMTRWTRKRRKKRTRGKISGTLTCSAGRQKPQVYRGRQRCFTTTYWKGPFGSKI